MIQWLEECYIRNAAVIQHFIQHPSVLPSDLLEDTGPFLSSAAPRWPIKKQLMLRMPSEKPHSHSLELRLPTIRDYENPTGEPQTKSPPLTATAPCIYCIVILINVDSLQCIAMDLLAFK